MDNGSLYLDDFLSASGADAYPCFSLNTERPTHSARRIHAAYYDDVVVVDDDDDDDDDVDYDYNYNYSDGLDDDIGSKISRTNKIQLFILRHLGHVVAQLVEALRYKPENRGFDSRWYQWTFSLT